MDESANTFNDDLSRLFIDERDKYISDEDESASTLKQALTGSCREAKCMYLIDKHLEKSNSKLENQNSKYGKLFNEKDRQINKLINEKKELR